MSSNSNNILPDQDHIDWDSPSIQQTIKMMETSYPGGLVGYVNKAKLLLSHNTTAATTEQQQEGGENPKRNLKNPAHKVDIDVADASEHNMSNLRLGNSLAGKQTIFVLVAGGLGERLGAKSLKLALPVWTCDQDTYLSSYSSSSPSSYVTSNFIAHYLSWMSHLRGASADLGHVEPTPIIIMTSDDTHSRTQVLLEDFFAAFPESAKLLDIKLLKQNGVPCVSDNNGKLATTPDGKSFLMKPHGHGDIHRLILSSGVIPPLIKRGFKYIAFLQDTNAGATTTIPFSLATMENKNWAMSFTCVPRLPGEAIGALVEADDANPMNKGRRVTYCVEYNVLDEMLKNEGIAGGDSVPTFPPENPKFSPFPGTINTLLLRLNQYNETIERTQGVIAEFINPKYADPKLKTNFKSPARLETLMQDIALELSSGDNENASTTIIGACVFDRRTYFPVKNALKDGISKWKLQGIDPHNGCQGEAGIHLLRRLMWANFVNKEESVSKWSLEKCVPSPEERDAWSTSSFCDVVVEHCLPVSLFPILLSETFGKEGLVGISKHFSSSSSSDSVKISRRSSLILKGNVVIKSLNLDGALVVDATTSSGDAEIIIDLPSDYVLYNDGWKAKSVREDDDEVDEAHKLRGYKFVEEETSVFKIPSGENNNNNSGEKIVYVLTLDGKTGEPSLVRKNNQSNL